MSGGSPINGVVDNYDDMTPIPIISYNLINNTLVINNPVQTPQVAAHPSQNNFNDIKTPGIYHYEILGGPPNAPTTSPNFTSIEIGRDHRY